MGNWTPRPPEPLLDITVRTDGTWGNTHVYDNASGAELLDVHLLSLTWSGEALFGYVQRYNGPESAWHFTNTRHQSVFRACIEPLETQTGE